MLENPEIRVNSNIFDTFAYMDDFQFWLYVILGVVYLISQVRKKSKAGQELPDAKPAPRKTANTPANPRSYEQRPEPANKPITFEELLREITEAKTKPELPEPAADKTEYVNYEEDLEDEFVQPEVVTAPHNFPYSAYEEAKWKDYTKGTLEDTLKLENVDMRYNKFKEFEDVKRESFLDQFTSDLKNTDGLKRAFVLSEILTRKEF